MGYYEHLKELLYPLRMYELESGIGAAELKAIGAAMDRHCETQNTLEREATPASASHYGLEAYEEIMPFVPAYQLIEERRKAISALLRIDDMSFTPEAINSTAAGCGIAVEVLESETPETVVVAIINTRGVPPDFSNIKSRIEQILPCHLDVEYRFIYTTWNEFMNCIDSWNEIEQIPLDWHSMEIYIEN